MKIQIFKYSNSWHLTHTKKYYNTQKTHYIKNETQKTYFHTTKDTYPELLFLINSFVLSLLHKLTNRDTQSLTHTNTNTNNFYTSKNKAKQQIISTYIHSYITNHTDTETHTCTHTKTFTYT